MAGRKLPWIKFYPRDWRGDHQLIVCSLAARGLWVEMLFLMHENADRRGYLTAPDGGAMTAAQLARKTRGDVAEVQALLAELGEAGVYSTDQSGVIYSRRMVADQAMSEACSEAGKRGGGNPDFRTENNPRKRRHKGIDKGVAKVSTKVGTNSEARSQIPEEKIVADATPPASEKPAEAKPRPRNELFDAVAEVTHSDPAVDGAHVGKTSAALAKASPPFTPAEVREFGRRWRELLPWAKPDEHPRLTVGIIAKHITALRAAGRPPDPPRIKRAADNPLLFPADAAPLEVPR